MTEPLVIDVAPTAPAVGIVVVVEPLYGCVAVAAALDAGWGSVELASEADTAPIPLVSFEQAPPVDQRGGRCRVRCSDLASVAFDGALLGAPAIARPLGARLAAHAHVERVTFVPAPSTHAPTDTTPQLRCDTSAADSHWAAGMLIRVLLDELDGRDAILTDAAGIAVAIATGAEDVGAMLSAGARWRRHIARGGASDDLRIASAVDSMAVIPRVRREGDSYVAEPWAP